MGRRRKNGNANHSPTSPAVLCMLAGIYPDATIATECARKSVYQTRQKLRRRLTGWREHTYLRYRAATNLAPAPAAAKVYGCGCGCGCGSRCSALLLFSPAAAKCQKSCVCCASGSGRAGLSIGRRIGCYWGSGAIEGCKVVVCNTCQRRAASSSIYPRRSNEEDDERDERKNRGTVD